MTVEGLTRVALAGALVLGITAPAAADSPCQLGELGCVLDGDGATIDADAAYRDTVARGESHWLRAAIEEGLLLGAGTAWYWIDRERQVADWDFPSLKQRFNFEAWRLDSNPFPINFFGHAFNGAGFHLLARSNDLSLPAALGYGFATSMVWEYALEFREKISINDVILTPIAGLTGGEFFHWLAVTSREMAPRRCAGLSACRTRCTGLSMAGGATRGGRSGIASGWPISMDAPKSIRRTFPTMARFLTLAVSW